METIKRCFFIGVVISCVFTILYIILINDICFPWRDEIGSSDTAVNVVMHGTWWSHVWKYTYNPLHAFILTGWLWMFGVSHQTVCSLSVVLGLVGYLLLLRILIKRGVVQRRASVVVLTMLYWGGLTFSRLLTQGRIDLLVMIFTILLVNELIPHNGKMYSERKWPTVLYAFLLMFSSVYSIPVLCVMCVMLYCKTKETDIRRQLRIRYAWAMGAFIVSFALCCLFFAWNHSLFKFINSFISFNATVNSDAQGRVFVERVYDAYRIDLMAMAVAVCAILIAGVKLGWSELWKRHGVLVMFVVAIPLLMVVSGRYRSYYSWIFYIPSLVMLVLAIGLCEKNSIMKVFVVVAVLAVGLKPTIDWRTYKEGKTAMNRIASFMNASDAYLTRGVDVVFNSPKHYYFLVDKEVTLWEKYKGLEEMEQPEEKFEKFINKKIKNNSQRERVRAIFRQVEQNDPYLPQTGLLIADSPEDLDRVKVYMDSHQMEYENLVSSNGYYLLRFRQKDTKK